MGGFSAILQSASLLDGDGHWAGGDATLVQTGDVTDRGDDVRAAMELLMRLEAEAAGWSRLSAMNLMTRGRSRSIRTRTSSRRARRRLAECAVTVDRFWRRAASLDDKGFASGSPTQMG